MLIGDRSGIRVIVVDHGYGEEPFIMVKNKRTGETLSLVQSEVHNALVLLMKAAGVDPHIIGLVDD